MIWLAFAFGCVLGTAFGSWITGLLRDGEEDYTIRREVFDDVQSR